MSKLVATKPPQGKPYFKVKPYLEIWPQTNAVITYRGAIKIVCFQIRIDKDSNLPSLTSPNFINLSSSVFTFFFLLFIT